MKRETSYGQAATGNYVRMPFNRCNLGSEQRRIDGRVVGDLCSTPDDTALGARSL